MASAEYMRRYRYALLNEAKKVLGDVCVNCGTDSELEFDHVDPTTKVAPVSTMWNRGREAFWAEVAKCQLLCSPCHWEKSVRDAGLAGLARGQHGTASAYKYCGPPKCEPCKAAKRELHRRWRASKRVLPENP